VTGRAADLGMLHSWWRSSLRVRVITITMVLGTVLAALIGSVVFGQVAQGLVRQAVETATLDAAQQARRVQEQFEAIDQRDNSSLNTAAFETVNLIAPSEQETRGVVLARALSNERDPRSAPTPAPTSASTTSRRPCRRRSTPTATTSRSW